jgi:hypothetical protein
MEIPWLAEQLSASQIWLWSMTEIFYDFTDMRDTQTCAVCGAPYLLSALLLMHTSQQPQASNCGATKHLGGPEHVIIKAYDNASLEAS